MMENLGNNVENLHHMEVISDEGIDELSEPLPSNELCADIPKIEDAAFKAIRSGDLTRITSALKEVVDINLPHFESPGDSIFTLKSGSLARQIRLKEYTLLHLAVIHGDIQTVKLVLSHSPDVNVVDANHRSPLSVAAALQRSDVVRLLIKERADVNVQSVSGRTPLIEAITNSNLNIVRQLIQAGAELDLKDLKGTTPLSMCLSGSPLISAHIAQALVDGGCTVDLPNKQGATPLMMAISIRRLDIAKILLDAGADINQIDKTGKTIFHMASGVNTALFLLNHGASSDHPDKNGIRPLDRAAQVGHIALIRLLLASDAQRSPEIMDVPRVVQARQQVPIFDKWLTEELYSPRDLKRLCRQVIRQSLSPFKTSCISDLPIPQLLKDFLLAKHLTLSF